MSTLSSFQEGRALGRAAVERGKSVELSAETERVVVSWFVPDGDTHQHATVDALPTEGGGVSTLGGHDYAEAPAYQDRRMRHIRPFCDLCFTEYLKLHTAQPSWKG
ncbi:hypothetical protein ACOQFL_09930 [Actinopolyspora sp. H202]|uniref:hypothetical protein n=1 Tax=Actinopolyspora sp. H202 TaxID=1500456 RepID=UPI003EE6DDDB